MVAGRTRTITVTIATPPRTPTTREAKSKRRGMPFLRQLTEEADCASSTGDTEVRSCHSHGRPCKVDHTIETLRLQPSDKREERPQQTRRNLPRRRRSCPPLRRLRCRDPFCDTSRSWDLLGETPSKALICVAGEVVPGTIRSQALEDSPAPQLHLACASGLLSVEMNYLARDYL